MLGPIRRPWRFVTTKVLRRTRRPADPAKHLDRTIARALATHERAVAELDEAIARQQQSSIRLHGKLAGVERSTGDVRAARRTELVALLDATIDDTFDVHDRRDHLERLAGELKEQIIEAASLLDELGQVERSGALTTTMARLSSTHGADIPTPDELDERIRARLDALDTAR